MGSPTQHTAQHTAQEEAGTRRTHTQHTQHNRYVFYLLFFHFFLNSPTEETYDSSQRFCPACAAQSRGKNFCRIAKLSKFRIVTTTAEEDGTYFLISLWQTAMFRQSARLICQTTRVPKPFAGNRNFWRNILRAQIIYII